MFRKFALTTLVLLSLEGVYGQNSSKKSEEQTLPVIPEFDICYTPSMVLVSTDGYARWKSRYYKKNGDYIGEIRGEANIDVGFLFYSEKVYVGLITRINYTKSTIETIIYNNGAKDNIIHNGKKLKEDKVLNSYERRIAMQESIDTLLANDISLEFSDYNSGKLVDVETGRVIETDSYGLQESYFTATKKIDGKRRGFSREYTVHVRGKEYDVSVIDSVDDEGKKFLYADLQFSDKDNPKKKNNILKEINWLKLYYDDGPVPYKVIAEVNVDILGMMITKEILLTLK